MSKSQKELALLSTEVMRNLAYVEALGKKVKLLGPATLTCLLRNAGNAENYRQRPFPGDTEFSLIGVRPGKNKLLITLAPVNNSALDVKLVEVPIDKLDMFEASLGLLIEEALQQVDEATIKATTRSESESIAGFGSW